MNDTTTPPTVEIPLDVRDNSETVTDYAHMGHRSPGKGITTPKERSTAITQAAWFGYSHTYEYEINPSGQRCRFDVIRNAAGGLVHFFHTEYFTRVACVRGEWCHSYATYYVRQEDPAGNLDFPAPYCDEHAQQLIGERIDPAHHEYNGADGMVYYLSERLRIGQHD